MLMSGLAVTATVAPCNVQVTGQVDGLYMLTNVTNDGAPVYKLWSHATGYLYRVSAGNDTRWGFGHVIGEDQNPFIVTTSASPDLIESAATWSVDTWNSTSKETYQAPFDQMKIICSTPTPPPTPKPTLDGIGVAGQ